MELTYNELRKRDVINVADGRCLGRITDVKFSFPKGILTGIFLPARKNKGIFWFLDRSTMFIDVSKIIKIGGDVILVDIRCGDNCMPNTSVKKPINPDKKPPNNCVSPCNNTLDLSDMFDKDGRIDLDDY